MKSAKNLSELFPNKLTNWKKFSFKNLKKDQLLILLLAGILLMVIAVPAGKTKEHASSASDGNTGKNCKGGHLMGQTKKRILPIWKTA